MTTAHAPAPGGSVAAGADAPTTSFDPDIAWAINPRVAVRPEPFGALLYHFGTRKLSFLKNLVIVEVVRSLHEHPSANAAIDTAGINADSRAQYLSALDALARSEMIVPAATRSAT
ncbi:mycofactocin biosynthesis chaperone MftB [Tsukamurella asaccharolytica]|uniref:Mycofactocin biosynthesis chaperone MftB n=1 Tax=Tsukamurella asaccharolytica TaxID=2592067 RepID=A0A5C5R8D2_9ACTN|nr:mycofactocin biosynthesis chaperone MftB [Tsukamurella asaccharolytica]TWS18441.1 mycofactocin biosynthesis chaperone MftB [Tsukamurella asaccharolytica]